MKGENNQYTGERGRFKAGNPGRKTGSKNSYKKGMGLSIAEYRRYMIDTCNDAYIKDLLDQSGIKNPSKEQIEERRAITLLKREILKISKDTLYNSINKKLCSGCNKEKKSADFGIKMERGKASLNSRCKDCINKKRLL